MAKVWNDSRFTLSCTQINKSIAGHKFVTVSDEVAKRVPQNGVFRVEFDEATPAKRKKKDEADAGSEQLGDHPTMGRGTAVWFSGGPKEKK